MGHRKFRQPRRGNLGFHPKKRTKHTMGKIRSFPKDDPSQAPHLTGFAGFKCGMTHIVRQVDRVGSVLHKKEMVEAVTIIETPPLKVVGLVGYVETLQGLRAMKSVWASKLDVELKKRFSKNWHRSKKNCFSKYAKKVAEDEGFVKRGLDAVKKYCSVVRVLCHTQHKLLGLKQKKANLFEIQVNGGDIAQKVDFAYSLFEQDLRVDQVFKEGECIDVMGATKGKGVQGVIKRFGTKKLPRKTHRGNRKVGCIGAWHPAGVQWTVARTGQMGFHHRTERNKRIYRIGQAERDGAKNNATAEDDLTQKNITPMGGFPHYGVVRNQYLMIKGCCVGVKKRALMLRKALHPKADRNFTQKLVIKFIDTSSKMGHGRFQTSEEKDNFFVSSKKVQLKRAEKAEA